MLKKMREIKSIRSNLFEHLERNYDHDSRYVLSLPFKKYFFTANKEDYAEVLIRRYNEFEKGKASKILKLLFGGGLVVASLERWKKSRKIISLRHTFLWIQPSSQRT